MRKAYEQFHGLIVYWTCYGYFPETRTWISTSVEEPGVGERSPPAAHYVETTVNPVSILRNEEGDVILGKIPDTRDYLPVHLDHKPRLGSCLIDFSDLHRWGASTDNGIPTHADSTPSSISFSGTSSITFNNSSRAFTFVFSCSFFDVFLGMIWIEESQIADRLRVP